MNKSVFIYSNRCQRRKVDVALLEEYFKVNGWIISQHIGDANLVLVHTCAATGQSERNSLDSVVKADRLKKESAKLIVCGCLPKINKERLDTIFKGAAFAPSELHKIDEIVKPKIKIKDIPEPNIIKDFSLWGKTKIKPHASSLDYPDSIYQPDKVYTVRISKGCLGNCSYCAIKLAIGNVVSKPYENIIAEFREGLAKGYKLFEIISEDIGAYGTDIGLNIVKLLEGILSIEGNFKLMIKDININWIIKYLDKIKIIFSKYSNKIDFVVIPIQSGSNKILKLMNRPYTVECAINSLIQLKGIKVCTHIMIGFPGETSRDFQDTLRLMSSYSFSFVDLYEYSDRPGTVSSGMGNKISEKTKKSRCLAALKLRYKLYKMDKILKNKNYETGKL